MALNTGRRPPSETTVNSRIWNMSKVRELTTFAVILPCDRPVATATSTALLSRHRRKVLIGLMD